jgi:hypothetical protein
LKNNKIRDKKDRKDLSKLSPFSQMNLKVSSFATKTAENSLFSAPQGFPNLLLYLFCPLKFSSYEAFVQ